MENLDVNKKLNKLCFLCHKNMNSNNKININSITHQGIKWYIKQKLKKFESLFGKNDKFYDTQFIHFSCYEKIENCEFIDLYQKV